jgi:hypothetical protein
VSGAQPVAVFVNVLPDVRRLVGDAMGSAAEAPSRTSQRGSCSGR